MLVSGIQQNDSIIQIHLFPGGPVVKNPPANAGNARDLVRSLSWEDPLEEEMVTCFSMLAWKIPWTEEPGGLSSMGVQRVRHDWATVNTHTSILFQILFYYGWLQDIEYSFLCYTGGPCLHICYIVVCIHGEGNGTPLQGSCLENSMDRGAWWAIIHGVANSRTWLSNWAQKHTLD